MDGSFALSTKESRKRAARAYQAVNPGTSYTRALRQVGNKDQRRPLTAVLGEDRHGQSVSVNLEWTSVGGDGPHCVIVGDEVPSLLAVLAAGLAAGQRPEDLELVLCGSAATQLGVEHRRVNPDQLARRIAELLRSRLELLHSLDASDVEDARRQGHHLPTTVVLIEDHDARWSNPPLPRRPLRGRLLRTSETISACRSILQCGGPAGINLILGAPSTRLNCFDDDEPCPATQRVLEPPVRMGLYRLLQDALAGLAESLMTDVVAATIFGHGNQRATLHTLSQWDPLRRARRPGVQTDFSFTAR